MESFDVTLVTVDIQVDLGTQSYPVYWESTLHGLRLPPKDGENKMFSIPKIKRETLIWSIYRPEVD